VAVSARAAAVVLALVVLGCEAVPDLGAGCTRSSECGSPFVCAIGRCRAECADSRDCPTLARCLIEPSSGLGVCSLERVDACSEHDCALGFVCQRGVCVNACDVIAACPDGLCEDGACTPVRGDAGVASDAGASVEAGPDASSGQRTITASIVDDADDGEIAGAGLLVDGEESLGVDYAGSWTATPTRAFLRFALPEAIPASATILSATVEVVASAADGVCAATDALSIVAASAPDAPQPTRETDYPGAVSTGGLATTATVRWGPLTAWVTGPVSSPDLSPIFEELVRAHGGLAAGAHVSLWFVGESFTRDCEGGWADSASAGVEDPRLVVTFAP
jgi:hypothetical protein